MKNTINNDTLDKRKERRKRNSNLEVSGTQEFFTSKVLCDEMLDKISEEDWKDISKTFLDPTCGNVKLLKEGEKDDILEQFDYTL